MIVSLSTSSVVHHTLPNPSTSGVTLIAPAYFRKRIKGDRASDIDDEGSHYVDVFSFGKLENLILTNRRYPRPIDRRLETISTMAS